MTDRWTNRPRWVATRAIGGLALFLATLHGFCAEISCRSIKSSAQCAQEERAARERAPKPDPVASDASGAVPLDRVTVLPDPEDLPRVTKGKLEAFRERLTAKAGYEEIRGNDGTWMKCVKEPPECKVNCCVRISGR